MFRGLALDKQQQNDESEAAYQTAAKAKGNDALAWQGLVTLYEKQAGKKLERYREVVLNLARIYMEQDDRTKCQSAVDKYVDFAKKYGSRVQIKHALEVLLPSSTVYDYLEGLVPQPAITYKKLAAIVEVEEKEKINKEIESTKLHWMSSERFLQPASSKVFTSTLSIGATRMRSDASSTRSSSSMLMILLVLYRLTQKVQSFSKSKNWLRELLS